MKQIDIVKRIVLLQLKGLCLVFEGFLYAYFWYSSYADGIQIIFWNRGHWLVIAINIAILVIFPQLYGGLKIGYSKPSEVFFLNPLLRYVRMYSLFYRLRF